MWQQDTLSTKGFARPASTIQSGNHQQRQYLLYLCLQALDRWEERLEALFEGRPYDELDATLTDTLSQFPVDIQPFRWAGCGALVGCIVRAGVSVAAGYKLIQTDRVTMRACACAQ